MKTQLSDYSINDKIKRRFWSKVSKDGECWEWQASCGFRDYGKFRIGPTYIAAHRVAYYLEYGPFDERLLVCHKCDNPKCVRPEHLFLGTQSDNNWDKIKKGRHSYICRNPPLSPDKVEEIRRLAKGVRNQKGFMSGMVSLKELARRFEVGTPTISRIINHKGVYNA